MGSVETFVNLLRQEEDECTEILKTVEVQQDNLIARAIDLIPYTAEDIARKLQALSVTRQQRDMAQQIAAVHLQTEASLEKIVPKLPPHVRGEVQDLIGSINQTLLAIKRVAAENQRLTQASLKLTPEVVREVQLQELLQKL